MVIYLAGLEGIPDELDEASAVDGASTVGEVPQGHAAAPRAGDHGQRDAHAIFGFGVFDQVLAVTGGGPVNATETLATQVWQADVRLRALWLRHGAGADPAGADHDARRWRSSSLLRDRERQLLWRAATPLHAVRGGAACSSSQWPAAPVVLPRSRGGEARRGLFTGHRSRFRPSPTSRTSAPPGNEHRARRRASDGAGKQPHHHRRERRRR